nr:phospholipase A2-activating protein [Tanacetum cinerariifolium]
SILNCIDQGGLISSEMYTLVLVWNLATGEKVHMLKGRKMQATYVTLDGSDVVSVSSVDCIIIRWKGDDLVYYFEGTSNASSQPNTLGIRKEGKENMAYFVSKTTLASKDLIIKKIKSCWVVFDNHCKGSEVTNRTKIKDDTLGKLVLLYQPSVHLREFLTSSLSIIAGKDLETENGNSRASLGAMKTMLENVIGSVKRIQGDKEDCILESQDKKVDNDVKEIRKISCLSNLIFGDDDMNLSFHQNINTDYVVMGVNEFVGGANRSEENLVLRSNSRFLAGEYERNIFEVEDKKGIGADACKFAISILNCIDQGGLISSEMYTLVLVWNLANNV